MMLTMYATQKGMQDQQAAQSENSTAMGDAFDDSMNDDSFYLPPEVFDNADFKRGIKNFVSPDGKSVRFIIEHDGDPATPPDYKFATLFYPEAAGEYINVDQRLAPRRGWGGNVVLRGGLAGAGSDTTFVQAYVHARWFKGLGKDSRLLVRGELGHTFSGDLDLLPPTLRFHAGGDRSIRGYGWREVGPRIGAAGDEFPVGARNVVTGSIEYERYFNGPWGMAVFVDSGSAFDSDPEWRTGVGVGLRWRSPVGPLRVDIAHGLDHPDSPLQITLNFGADL